MESMTADLRQHSMSTALPAMARADLTEVLPTVRVATRLIWGALDARSPLSVARDLERRIPGADLAVIPDCGHVSNLEAPGPFNELVRTFLHERG
jgi:pimeloyl-ACP methyl ester carboxylesterase